MVCLLFNHSQSDSVMKNWLPLEFGLLEFAIATRPRCVKRSREWNSSGKFAPKIELPGLKVVGKIDLPEPIKKEVPQKTEESEASEEKEKSQRKRSGDRNRKTGKRRNQDPDYNPIKEKREREKRRKERELAQQKKKEKQKKAQHYYGKVAPQQAKSNPKKKPSQPSSYSQVVLENEQRENQGNKKGNVLVRLWKWLNTY